MIFYLTAIANGFLNTINRMTNVKAKQCLGTTNGTLINYIEATIIAFVLVFLTGNGAELNWAHVKEVPIVFYLGAICGLVAMIFIVIGTPKTGAMLSSVLMLIGQLSTSIILDYVFFNEFSMIRVVGIFLIILGIAWRDRLKEKSA
ncbi:DMT family transporter [Anaerotignum sp.]|nr:DMT family transporter [Anaerotignum sp.]MBQ7757645.1 DMT family transporter [Anaerotignum sp.]